MKRFYDVLSVLMVAMLCIVTVLFPVPLSVLVKKGMDMCIKTLIPALFPFLVITGLITRSGIADRAGSVLAFILSPLLGIPKNVCGVFLSGLLGGFPNGAVAASYAYSTGRCTKRQAETVVALANNASFSFLMTVCGISVLGGIKGGLILIAAEMLTILITAQLLRVTGRKDELYWLRPQPVQYKTEPLSGVFCKSVSSAVKIMGNICGYVIAFQLLSGIVCMLISHFLHSPVPYVLATGIFEISTGVLSCTHLDFPVNYVVISMICGYSGLCVLCQVTDICIQHGLSPKLFIISRLLGFITMPVCTTVLLLLLPRETISVYGSTVKPLPNTFSGSLGITLVYAVFSVGVLVFLSMVWRLKARSYKKP